MSFIQDIVINISRATKGLKQSQRTPLVLVSSGTSAAEPEVITELSDVTDLGYSTSSAPYEMIAAMFAQSPRPSRVYLMVTDQDYVDELADLVESIDFRAIVIDSRAEVDLNAVGTWANSNKKFFFGCTSGVPSARNVDREAYLIHNNSADDYPECAWVGQNAPKTPGSFTWKWKVLNGQNASTFTGTQLTAIRDLDMQALQEQAGAIYVNEGKTTSGEFIDIIDGQDWVEEQLELEILSAFLNNAKISLDDTGISIIEGKIRSVLKRAGDNGIIARAVSKADLELSDDKQYMYQVTVPKRADLSTTDKSNRILSGVEFVYYVAGAIHKTTITGLITV